VLRGIFGVLAIIIGLAIIAWIGYNAFVERLPEYTGFHWWKPFGMAPVLVSTGTGCAVSDRPADNGGLQPPT
jgi:hypothetical protein